MADVVGELRASSLRDAPGFDTDASGLPTRWGPDPAALGDAVFPPGSAFGLREQINDAAAPSATASPTSRVSCRPRAAAPTVMPSTSPTCSA